MKPLLRQVRQAYVVKDTIYDMAALLFSIRMTPPKTAFGVCSFFIDLLSWGDNQTYLHVFKFLTISNVSIFNHSLKANSDHFARGLGYRVGLTASALLWSLLSRCLSLFVAILFGNDYPPM